MRARPAPVGPSVTGLARAAAGFGSLLRHTARACVAPYPHRARRITHACAGGCDALGASWSTRPSAFLVCAAGRVLLAHSAPCATHAASIHTRWPACAVHAPLDQAPCLDRCAHSAGHGCRLRRKRACLFLYTCDARYIACEAKRAVCGAYKGGPRSTPLVALPFPPSAPHACSLCLLRCMRTHSHCAARATRASATQDWPVGGVRQVRRYTTRYGAAVAAFLSSQYWACGAGGVCATLWLLCARNSARLGC